ncbi:DUF4855 domain-containing protein [Alicyclobacillus shizuokensis]|uniref:DUF4855 domain-containing protein n=1 Tax=Alicyclobacillus shizuokensis TaxID=392014 RepID=UPI0008342BD6|nr:DUF4855 domain-containing protein [Alicyclobacillus shizuokensis]MCL6625113.1 DUF4855 domain-containing protein [Alicyclobacillus shizuokensis]
MNTGKWSRLGASTIAGAGMMALLSAPTAASPTPSDVDLALHRPYQVSTSVIDDVYHASETVNFPDDGSKLTDGVVGPASWSAHGPWVGYLRQDRHNVTVDLGKSQTLHKLDAWLLQDTASGIYFPRHMKFSVSLDGKHWSCVGTAKPSIPISQKGVFTQAYTVSHLNVIARYVRYTFYDDVFVFLSEVEAFGLPGIQPGAVRPRPTPSRPDGDAGFPRAGSVATSGRRAEVLIPSGYYSSQPELGVWHLNELLPYVAYLNTRQQIRGRMFDSFLFTPFDTGPSGGSYGTGTATQADWKYFADQLFQSGLQLDALDQAVAQTDQALHQKNWKAKVVIGIPFPGLNSNWGDGLDFNPDHVGQAQSLANREAAVRWYVSYVKRKFASAGFRHLELTGFYWQNESVYLQWTPNDEKLIRDTGRFVHSLGHYTFDWIPYNEATGFRDWRWMGFDTALMQPNYAFTTGATVQRLQSTAQLARHYGLGIEMEMHWDITRTDSLGTWARQNYQDYLSAAYTYHYQNSFLAWYQNTTTLLDCETSQTPAIRQVYDETYQFIHGQYQPVNRPGGVS